MTDKDMKELCLENVQPENVTHRSFLFTHGINMCEMTKDGRVKLSKYKKFLVWFDLHCPVLFSLYYRAFHNKTNPYV